MTTSWLIKKKREVQKNKKKPKTYRQRQINQYKIKNKKN